MGKGAATSKAIKDDTCSPETDKAKVAELVAASTTSAAKHGETCTQKLKELKRKLDGGDDPTTVQQSQAQYKAAKKDVRKLQVAEEQRQDECGARSSGPAPCPLCTD